jgi:hypothetical protein
MGKKVVIATVLVAALAAGTAALVGSSQAKPKTASAALTVSRARAADEGGNEGTNDGEGRESGPEADRAKAAALRATGGGHVNAVERDNEDGATWEVEVTKNDGQTVDVREDANYNVMKIESDAEGG